MDVHTNIEQLPETLTPLNTVSDAKTCYERHSVAQYVQKWGGSASIGLLDPVYSIFSTPEIEGIIGYRTECNCSWVCGDPLCNVQDIPKLVEAFHHFCDSKGQSVIYAGVSENFAKWAMQHVCYSLIEFGEELHLNPQIDPATGYKGRALRNKINRSLRENVAVKEYTGGDPQIENTLEQVADSWLKSREGAQIHLYHVRLFAHREGKRWFFAQQNDLIIGVLSLDKLEAHGGWVVNMLMTTPEAPHGTSEQLVTSALCQLRQEGCQFLTFGLVTIDRLGVTEGLGLLSTWLARTGFQVIKKYFGLDGRRRYWKKFQPEGTAKYLLINQQRIGIREVMGILKSVNVI